MTLTTNLRLVRLPASSTATLGHLSLPGSVVWTLENPPGKDKGPIPCGTYPLELRWSNRFQMLVPGLLGVPGFEDVEIHAGNTDADTRGCILVGLYRVSEGEIAQSRAALAEVLQCWRAWESRAIDITDGDPRED